MERRHGALTGGQDVLVDWLARAIAPRVEHTSAELPEGVTLRRSRLVPALGGLLARMGGPAAAVTLGNTILLHPAVRPSARLLRHELAHVRQWRAAPLSFPLRYLWRHLRHGYAGNPYELEARAAETRDENHV